MTARGLMRPASLREAVASEAAKTPPSPTIAYIEAIYWFLWTVHTEQGCERGDAAMKQALHRVDMLASEAISLAPELPEEVRALEVACRAWRGNVVEALRVELSSPWMDFGRGSSHVPFVPWLDELTRALAVLGRARSVPLDVAVGLSNWPPTCSFLVHLRSGHVLHVLNSETGPGAGLSSWDACMGQVRDGLVSVPADAPPVDADALKRRADVLELSGCALWPTDVWLLDVPRWSGAELAGRPMNQD